jgi:hypothetical protein
MKKLSVLAALAFALAASTANSQACDLGMHTANATPVVVVCEGNGCTAVSTTQQAAANPESAAPQATTDEATSSEPVAVADSSGGR